MEQNDNNHRSQSSRSSKVIIFLVSLVAIAAIWVSVYALKQKKEATAQAALAKSNMLEALQQQKIALEQGNVADSNKEQALQQRELALESEKRALQQRKIADAETRKAEESRLEALKQQYVADEQKLYAAQQKKIAEDNAAEAKKQQYAAETQRNIANDQKQISAHLKQLADSRKMAKEAIQMISEHHFDSGRDKALQAYQLNNINNGPEQNSDIYDALNINWIRSVNNKNQYNLHNLPVHCISGIPGSNIIFTADEAGMLYESAIKDNGCRKIASFEVKEEVRALAVSHAGNNLVVVTASGNGMLFKISSSGVSFVAAFKFPGTGKAVCFDNEENIILLSNKGIGKYQVSDLGKPAFLNYESINCFASTKDGKLCIAQANLVKTYKDWNDLAHDAPSSVQKFDSKVSAITVDNSGQYMAAGTYNGYVWLCSNENNAMLWGKALHLSVVNDLAFSNVSGGTIQLASAGADQTIRLVNVTAIIQKTQTEDILTLKGHTKWIYALYYAQNGKWLCSTGEDNKVIAWKPAAEDLYKTITDNK